MRLHKAFRVVLDNAITLLRAVFAATFVNAIANKCIAKNLYKTGVKFLNIFVVRCISTLNLNITVIIEYNLKTNQ